LHAWAGARPLIRDARTSADDDGAASQKYDTRHMSRTMAIIDHQGRDGLSGLLTIAGGKLTTYRLMAQNVVDAMEAQLGTPHPCRTADEPVPAAASGHHYAVTHRLAEREAEHAATPDDMGTQIVCECELVTRAMLEEVMTAQPGGQFDDWRRQLRIGMGPCQGGFCGLRMAGIAVENGIMDATRATALLRLFLQHRWAGLWPTLSGAQARQAALDAAIYQGMYHLDDAAEDAPIQFVTAGVTP
ncbi:MAG: (2Fe-2S)-binding protein, partial [Propionibacteriaceae bacterium]|nr:(2Fe-2S)-binding protein [Propionibacteriaceae bacterium]